MISAIRSDQIFYTAATFDELMQIFDINAEGEVLITKSNVRLYSTNTIKLISQTHIVIGMYKQMLAVSGGKIQKKNS